MSNARQIAPDVPNVLYWHETLKTFENRLRSMQRANAAILRTAHITDLNERAEIVNRESGMNSMHVATNLLKPDLNGKLGYHASVLRKHAADMYNAKKELAKAKVLYQQAVDAAVTAITQTSLTPPLIVQNSKAGLLVRGCTYPHRDTLKAAGGQWDERALGWLFTGSELPPVVQALCGNRPAPSAPATKPAPKPLRPIPPTPQPVKKVTLQAADPRIAKWRKSADGLDKKIAHLHRPFGDQNVTHKRQAEYDSRIKEGDRLKKHQHALRGLADALERGELPAILAKLTRTETLLELAGGYSWSGALIFDNQCPDVLRLTLNDDDKAFINALYSSCKVSHAGNITLSHAEVDRMFDVLARHREEWAKNYSLLALHKRLTEFRSHLEQGLNVSTWNEARSAVQLLAAPISPASNTHRKLESLRMKAARMELPGYWPTPPGVISRMFDVVHYYHTWEHPKRILEPSAGSGEIAKAIRSAMRPDAQLDVVEISYSLREILKLEGLNLVADDFLKYTPDKPYDLVLMNPPFEKMADTEHVRHAYDLLGAGGLLVSVMSPGWQTRKDKKAAEFRAWFEAHGGQVDKLPDGSFTEGNKKTGVSTCLVTLKK